MLEPLLERAAGERVRGEWNVVVYPHFAAAFVGRDLGDDGADLDRRFDFCLTYGRDRADRPALNGPRAYHGVRSGSPGRREHRRREDQAA